MVVLGSPPRWMILDGYAVYIAECRTIDYEVVHGRPDNSSTTLQGRACIWLDMCASIEHMHVTCVQGNLQ